jgi:hypothetical protein
LALRAALLSRNEATIAESIQKCKEVGMDLEMIDIAQHLAKCLKPGM